MKREWESMTIDELFALRERIAEVLSAMLKARKSALERRFQTLSRLSDNVEVTKPRQP